jgi:hypothetical protein
MPDVSLAVVRYKIHLYELGKQPKAAAAALQTVRRLSSPKPHPQILHDHLVILGGLDVQVIPGDVFGVDVEGFAVAGRSRAIPASASTRKVAS